MVSWWKFSVSRVAETTSGAVGNQNGSTDSRRGAASRSEIQILTNLCSNVISLTRSEEFHDKTSESELDFSVVHKPGKTIGHVDALSRLPLEPESALALPEVGSSGKIVVPPGTVPLNGPRFRKNKMILRVPEGMMVS